MRTKIVDGKLDRLARLQPLQMINQQVVVDSVRMIEIRRIAIVERHVFKIAIVKILLDEDDLVSADRLQNPISNCRLTRAGAAADADDHDDKTPSSNSIGSL